jgi:hypothetical protein
LFSWSWMFLVLYESTPDWCWIIFMLIWKLRRSILFQWIRADLSIRKFWISWRLLFQRKLLYFRNWYWDRIEIEYNHNFWSLSPFGRCAFSGIF